MSSLGLIWRCPACRGVLRHERTTIRCLECEAGYETVDGIPDLRFPADSRAESDRALAQSLVEEFGREPPEKMVRAFFAVREGIDGWTDRETESRTRQSLESVARLRNELDGWLAPVTRNGVFLDLGCGLGGLMMAADVAGLRAIGIDNRMTVLVVARRLLERSGRQPVLACANAEAMPLADGTVEGVVMYDVVEHVDQLDRVLGEIRRVINAGGAFACSTPNRFSLAPEPHVHVWGVGWLPRRFQKAYVRSRSGRCYEGTQLLSPFELYRALRRNTEFDTRLRVPPIPAHELRSFGFPKRLVGTTFNSVARLAATRYVLLALGPFFQIIGIDRRKE